MEEKHSGYRIDKQNPIGKYQELSQQDKPKSYIDRVSAHGKYAACHKFIGLFGIYSHPEAFSK